MLEHSIEEKAGGFLQPCEAGRFEMFANAKKGWQTAKSLSFKGPSLQCSCIFGSSVEAVKGKAKNGYRSSFLERSVF